MMTGIERQYPFVINQWQQDHFLVKYGRLPSVVPNVRDFANPPEVNPEKIKELRDYCGVGEGDLLVVAPVRIVPRKNLKETLKLVKLLQEANPGRRVVLLFTHQEGDEGPEYLQEIEAMADEMGIERKHISDQMRDDVPGGRFDLDTAFAASDVVVYTPNIGGDSEGFGNAFIEGMLHRKLIISSVYPRGRDEILSRGVRAVRVDPHNLPGTIARANRILHDPAELKAFLDKNTEMGLMYFSQQALMAKLGRGLHMMERKGYLRQAV